MQGGAASAAAIPAVLSIGAGGEAAGALPDDDPFDMTEPQFGNVPLSKEQKRAELLAAQQAEQRHNAQRAKEASEESASTLWSDATASCENIALLCGCPSL